jgi:hypothetical protein
MKKQHKLILFSVLGITALALLLKPKKSGAVIPSRPIPDSGSSSNIDGQLSGLNYSSLANKLFEAFNGYGTNEKVVKDVFKMLKTDADYAALKDAYGIRKITNIYFLSFFEGDLPATIKEEMDAIEIADLNNILAFNNLTVRV